jgi:hypothetical protein
MAIGTALGLTVASAASALAAKAAAQKTPSSSGGTVTPSASVGGAGAAGGSGSGAVLSNANQVVPSKSAQIAKDLASGGNSVTGVTGTNSVAEKEKAGILAEYNKIMNDPQNAGITDWVAYGKALDAYAANQYLSGGTTTYFSPGGEAEASFQGLSAEDQKKAAAQLGNPGTYYDTGSGSVKNSNGTPASVVIPKTAAETIKAAEVKSGQVATPQGTPAKATLNGKQIDVIIGSDGRSVLTDGTPIKAGTIVEAANGKKYMRLSDNTSIPLTAYYNTIKREDENGNLIDTGRPVYFSDDPGNTKAFDANGNRVGQGDIVTDATGKTWIMQGSQGVPYNPGAGRSDTVANTVTQPFDPNKAAVDLTDGASTGDPTTDAFIGQMIELINNNPDIETMLKQGMTWEQALARAQSINNPLYAQAMEDSMTDITERALMSGLYGQLPTDALRLQTMGKLEADKINANNTLATELRSQDVDEIYKKYNALSDQAKTKIDNYLAMLGIYTDYTRDARDYAADRADTAWNQSYQEKQLAQQQSQWNSEFEYQKLYDQLMQQQYLQGYNLDVAKLMGQLNGEPTLDKLALDLSASKSSGSGGSGSGSGSDTKSPISGDLIYSEIRDSITADGGYTKTAQELADLATQTAKDIIGKYLNSKQLTQTQANTLYNELIDQLLAEVEAVRRNVQAKAAWGR